MKQIERSVFNEVIIGVNEGQRIDSPHSEMIF